MSHTDTLTVSLTWTAETDIELEWWAEGQDGTSYFISKQLVASPVGRDYIAYAICPVGSRQEQRTVSFDQAKRWCLRVEANRLIDKAY